MIHDCEINDELMCVWCKRPARTQDTRRNCPVSRGLGDTLAWFTALFGVAGCRRCGKRQEKLNELVPYKNEVSWRGYHAQAPPDWISGQEIKIPI